MFTIGVDVGSTYTKYCVMRDGEIERLFCEKTPVSQREYFQNRVEELLQEYPSARFTSCGYGKENIESIRNMNELTALSRGVWYVCPESCLVLDIGGQDTKVIRQEGGALKEFFVNDKCAAGSGIFLSNVLGMLGKTYDSIDLIGTEEPKIHLSSVCAVFAQSEIVELIAQGSLSAEEIIEGVIWQILKKSEQILQKVPEGEILLSGGLSGIRGISEFAKHALGRDIRVSEQGRYFSAIGAAISLKK